MTFTLIAVVAGFWGCNSSSTESSNNPAKPNILLIVVDDMGFSDLGCYGGEIKTPNVDALPDRGVRFSKFYTSSLCAPTRAMLITGVDNHQSGLGVMPPNHTREQYLQPGYEGPINNRVMTIAEVLEAGGYHTYMTGKWHLGHHAKDYPANRGFEKSFVFLGGGASHFNNAFPLSSVEIPITEYVRDLQIVELPDDFFSTINYTDEMISFISKQKDDAPLFGYLAYTAPHDPLHVTDDYFKEYEGVYDVGYAQIRQKRLERMKAMGMVAKDVPDNPGTGKFPTWDQLDEGSKKKQARRMELYASMIEQMDTNLGRLIETLKQEGRYENTIFIFMSDNGANPKEAWEYAPNTPESIARDYDNSLENVGTANSFIAQGGAWSEVSNTPFSYFKTTTGEGGIHAPLIICGPGVQKRESPVHTVSHVTDLFPTILDFAGTPRPASLNGRELAPLYGVSAKDFLSGSSDIIRDTEDSPLCFEMTENKAIIKGKWKALMLKPPYVQKAEWQLFNLETDTGEKNNLASSNPEKLHELVSDWKKYAKEVGYIEAGQAPLILQIGSDKFYSYEPLND